MPKAYDKKQQELTVPEHFYKPKNSSAWYVRLTPPAHVQHLIAEKSFRKSTGHSDIKRAKPVGMTLIADKLREWDQIARSNPAQATVPTTLASELIETICAARLYSWMRSDEEDRTEGIPDEMLADINEFCELSDKAIRSVLAQGPSSSKWSEIGATALEWASVMGYELDPKDPLFPKYVRDFARVELDANQKVAGRNLGDDHPTPPSPSSITKSRLSEVTEARLPQPGPV